MTKVKINCKKCGKEFEAPPAFRQKFCSVSCASSFRVGENAANWQGGKIEKICLVCATLFKVNKCHLKRRFCSRKCTDIYKAENYINEKSSLWKGNNVGKEAIHTWLIKNYGNAKKCQNPNCVYPKMNRRNCLMEKPSRYEWANIRNHQYRKNIKDYVQLCPSCHRKYDMNLLTLAKF